MRVQHNITCYLADSTSVLLVHLDLSSAFDTVDAAVLPETMHSDLGLFGAALAWDNSYISDRTQRVWIRTDASEERPIKCGVPQVSVLGPLLFICIQHECKA